MKEKGFKNCISSVTRREKWRFTNLMAASPPRYWYWSSSQRDVIFLSCYCSSTWRTSPSLYLGGMPSPIRFFRAKVRPLCQIPSTAPCELWSRNLSWQPSAIPSEWGIPRKIPASLLGFLACEQPNGGHEKGYGVKVMPECHKKKFDFLWKNKFGKKGLCSGNPEFFLFEVSSEAEKSIWGQTGWWSGRKWIGIRFWGEYTAMMYASVHMMQVYSTSVKI